MTLIRVIKIDTSEIIGDYLCEYYDLENGAIGDNWFNPQEYSFSILNSEEETEENEETIDNEGEDIIE